MNDPVEWAKSVAAAVKEYCGKAIQPILERVTALEQRQPEKGDPGKSVTVEEVAPLIELAVADAVAKIPAPKDGKSVTVDEVIPVIAEIVGKAVESIPKAKDGSSVTADELLPILIPSLEAKATEVARKAVSELPRPKDGDDGKSVTLEEVLPTVKTWINALPLPKDGKSVTLDEVLPLFHQAFDKWALDFERRAQDIHTRLLASFDKPKDGEDGDNGKDGLGFDDLRVEHDGERSFAFIFERGEQRKEFTFTVPVVLERGVYKGDRTYERGDAVTADGSYWIAQKDAPAGKPGQSPDWRLAVKKGRDGKGS